MLMLMLLLFASAAAPAADAKPGDGDGRPSASKKLRLKAFSSCPQLVRYARRNAARRDGVSAGPPRLGQPMPMPLPGLPVPDTAPSPQAAPLEQNSGVQDDQQSSHTNVQEAGVDEPDVVKTADGRIFALAGGKLHAVEADGLRLLGSVELQGYGHQLLLQGDRALVIGHRTGAIAASVAPMPVGEPQTLLAAIDVSDPAAMRVLSSQTVDGTFVGARQRGANVRVVVSSSPAALQNARVAKRANGWIPSAQVKRRPGARLVRRPLTRCRRVARPARYSGTGMLSVLTVDIAKGLPAVDVDALMTDGQTVYASAERLYVATPRWLPEPTASTQPPPPGGTTIHSFDASAPGVTAYRASGQVPGHLLNQFSLSEHDGVLRVATTQDPVWWPGETSGESESFVTVLRERGGTLAEIGRVGGLGRGERIYAVRFIGDAGYVVTFRQTDPLYTIGLANPALPRVLGELKILGYSAYLHPVAGDLLIGIGQDADERGMTRGTQVSLFDVSDLNRPRRLRQRPVGEYSSSEAEQDHHAFLWWEPAKLAVLPVSQQSFTGAIGFRVGRTAIDEAGRASHGADADPNPIRRAFVVGGRLFTLSEFGIEANDIGTLAEQARVAFPTD